MHLMSEHFPTAAGPPRLIPELLPPARVSTQNCTRMRPRGQQCIHQTLLLLLTSGHFLRLRGPGSWDIFPERSASLITFIFLLPHYAPPLLRPFQTPSTAFHFVESKKKTYQRTNFASAALPPQNIFPLFVFYFRSPPKFFFFLVFFTSLYYYGHNS